MKKTNTRFKRSHHGLRPFVFFAVLLVAFVFSTFSLGAQENTYAPVETRLSRNVNTVRTPGSESASIVP